MSFEMPSISPGLSPLILAVTIVLGSTHPSHRSWSHPDHSRFVFAEDIPIYEPSVTHHHRPSAGPRWGGNREVNERGSLTQLRELARSLRTCGGTNDALLQLQFLKDRRITCNDGSPAGYYLRKSQGSKRWIIFLEGGWFCHSRESCEIRRARQPHLTGSTTWRWKRPGRGILSSRPEENPRWWNANTVIIPYCSSDVWSGNAARHDKEPLSFLGARIVHEVVAELVQDGMSNARTVLLAGSSAGGTGVLLNLDRVATQLQELRNPARVRGLADSGWFVRPGTHDAGKELQTALRLWNSSVPERCHSRLGADQAWRCLYGYEMFPTLTTPVFVSQWLFDEAQLEADQVYLLGAASERGRRLAYLRELGGELRASLQLLPAVFAPACVAHTLITSSTWAEVKVKEVSLPEALQCWELSLEKAKGKNTKPWAVVESKQSKTGEPVPRIKIPRNRHIKKSAPTYSKESEGCTFRVVDSCPWPHCNPSCPTLRDARTGQEVGAVQLLTDLGLDVAEMAAQLGMEPLALLHALSHGN